jgi:hypothetical protein
MTTIGYDDDEMIHSDRGSRGHGESARWRVTLTRRDAFGVQKG